MNKKPPVWLAVLVVVILLASGKTQNEAVSEDLTLVVETPLRELRVEDPGLRRNIPGRTIQPRVTCWENGKQVNTCSPHWESTNPDAVSVDEKTGVIRFHAPGDAVVSVYWSETERETAAYGYFETLPNQPRRPLPPGLKVVKLSSGTGPPSSAFYI